MPQQGRIRANVHAAVTAAIVVLSFAAFGRGIPSSFVSDDTNAILANQYVTANASTARIFANYSWWGAQRADARGYRPLTTWTFARNYQSFGAIPAPFHVINILIHIGVCVAVYALALALGITQPAAAFSAAMFAVMPIHSEAVVWAVGRAELLAALGFLGCLLAGLRVMRGGHVVWAVLSAAALLLGAFSKENAVTALAGPFIAYIWIGRSPDLGPKASARQPSKAQARSRAAIWFAALCLGLGVYLLIRAAAGEMIGGTAANQLDNPIGLLPWLQRQAAALAVFGRYLWLSLVPLGLSVDYSFDALGVGSGTHSGFFADRYSLLGALGVAAASTAALAGLRAQRWAALAAATVLSLAAFSIVSNTVVVIGTAMGERLFYLPSFGLCIAGGLLFGAARERVPKAAVIVAVLVILTYTGASAVRCGDWQSPITLFEAAVAAHPRSARAHMELASAYGHAGASDAALQHFGLALLIKPDYAAAAYNRGNMLARVGRYPEAAQSYESAVSAKPRWYSAVYNLALVKRLQGDDAGALEVLEKLESGSRPAAIEMLRGEILLADGRNSEAIEAFTLALSAGAESSTALINRGVARERLSGCAAALEDYDKAAGQPGAAPQAAQNAAACRRVLGLSGAP